MICLLLLLILFVAACAEQSTNVAASRDNKIARWKSWVIGDVDQFRVPPPPVNAQAELDAIIQLQKSLSSEQLAEIHQLDVPVTTPWTESTLQLLERYWVLLPDVLDATPVTSSRAMAFVHVAIYDAVLASWHAKYQYHRAAPYQVDDRVRRHVREISVPSYPSEHAAAAAAVATLIPYLFQFEDSAHWNARAHAIAQSRVLAGAAYPSDIEAGWALGRAVAERVLAIAKADGSDRTWNTSTPIGAHVWKPTPPRFISEPFDPHAGSWRTWVIARGDAFRPRPPPAMKAQVFLDDVEELRNLPQTRTPQQAEAARFWATGPPPLRWALYMEDEIARRAYTTPEAAHAHALASIAMYDAFVACWDAKYHYWLLRPVTYDSTIVPLFSTPPFPSYPSGHSTMSAAVAEVFAHLFPDRAAHYRERAMDASHSRIWGAVHYRFDVIAGEELGRAVGHAVVDADRR